MTDPLEVTSEEIDGLAVVRVDGELDHQTAPLLVDELRRSATDGVERTVIDLTDCSFIDSAGARAIALGARDGGAPVGLACPDTNRRVMMVLELVGLVDLLEVRPAVACYRPRP